MVRTLTSAARVIAAGTFADGSLLSGLRTRGPSKGRGES